MRLCWSTWARYHGWVDEAKSPKIAAPRSGKRPVVLALLGVVAALALGRIAYAYLSFPSDRTPEGAYLRVAIAVNRGRAEDFFAYTETRAQHAAYTIRDFRKKARERVLAAYPEPERSRLAQEYAAEANAPDGSDLFALYAKRFGWMVKLRRDLSGIKRVEIAGDRATVETARGTRYAFRRRENGIWGLTLFTPLLDAEAERAARDFSVIDKAAADYARAPAAPAASAKTP
jgi:murein DD-endopeptidase MepM/ murein hydrolase activator NlpD